MKIRETSVWMVGLVFSVSRLESCTLSGQADFLQSCYHNLLLKAIQELKPNKLSFETKRDSLKEKFHIRKGRLYFQRTPIVSKDV